jgi:hypothetical protein
MAFHLKNLKTQKDKFFSSMTGQQLCDIVTDGEIMNYINRLTYRAGEIDTIFASIAGACDVRKTIAPGVRQKTLAPLVIQLSKIIKEYELRKVQNAVKVAETQRKQKEAENAAALAQANANRKAAENRQREANARAASNAEAAAKAAANAQLRNAQASANMAVANVSFNLTKIENSALTKELSNLKRNFNSLTSRLNKAIQNSRSATRNVAVAARRGGRRNATRKARRV